MIDKMLDKIEVMLLKLAQDDVYREALQNEYALYRSILEALPRSANVPDKLYSSVFSMEQRLTNYVILGKSANPMVDLSPMLSHRIVGEEEKQELLTIVNSNASYIAGRKSQIDVLKSYLEHIDFNGSIKDISSTIELVEREYLETNVYSNQFEKDLSRAKYHYMIKLIFLGENALAEELVQSFSYDMVWVIYDIHHDSVHRLLNEGRPSLAKPLNDFLTELPKDKEKDISFWKLLAQIENPDYTPNTDVIEIPDDSQVIYVDEKATILPAKKHRFSLQKLFQKKDLFVSKKLRFHHFAFEMSESMAKLDIWVGKNFEMNKKDLDILTNFLERAYARNNTAFSNVILSVHEEYGYIYDMHSVSFRTIIGQITKWAFLKNIAIYAQSGFHEIPNEFLSGCMFEAIEFHKGSWSIGAYAFSDCILLKKVDLSYVYVTRIGDFAFNNCLVLTKVMINTHSMNSYSFGKGVFCDCVALEEISWPYDIECVPEKTFMNCKSLISIGFNNISEVEASAFEGCVSLPKFSSLRVDKIGARAFYGCILLESFYFNAKCIVGDYAFAYSGIKDATLSVPFRTIGIGVFKGSKIKSAYFTGELAVPAEMFMECSELTSVTLSDDISLLGKKSFSGCKNLKTISGPTEFSYVGEECFADCTNLRAISIGNYATCIGKRAFYNCVSLTTFNYPELEAIEEEVFKGCSSIENITFGDLNKTPIITIHDGAFEGCARLRNFVFWDGLRIIGKKSFMGTDLTSMVLPDSVVEVGESAFAECKYLKTAKVSKKMKIIPSKLFYGCFNIKQIDMLHCEILAINDYAFAGCESLFEICMGNDLRNISATAFENDYQICHIIISTEVFYDIKDNRCNNVLDKLGLSECYEYESSTEDPDVVTITIKRTSYKN